MYLPYYAMKSPQENFIAVIDGMRFEFNVNVEVVDGVYKITYKPSSSHIE